MIGLCSRLPESANTSHSAFITKWPLSGLLRHSDNFGVNPKADVWSLSQQGQHSKDGTGGNDPRQTFVALQQTAKQGGKCEFAAGANLIGGTSGSGLPTGSETAFLFCTAAVRSEPFAVMAIVSQVG